MLLNLINLSITGKEAETLLDSVGLTANKNAIPNDPQKPWITSGLRLGTPACTSRGFVEEDFALVGELITKVLKNKDELTLKTCKEKVSELCKKYPIYSK